MPPRKFDHLLRDILLAAQKIVRWTSDRELSGFAGDQILVDAVMHNFAVIGEAARRMPAHVVAAHPEIAWAGMRGMRNLIVHEYEQIGLEIVWRTIDEDLPRLIEQLRAILDAKS